MNAIIPTAIMTIYHDHRYFRLWRRVAAGDVYSEPVRTCVHPHHTLQQRLFAFLCPPYNSKIHPTPQARASMHAIGASILQKDERKKANWYGGSGKEPNLYGVNLSARLDTDNVTVLNILHPKLQGSYDCVKAVL